MVKKIKKGLVFLLIAFFLLPTFTYSFLATKEITYQNEFQITFTYPSLFMDGFIEPLDDESELEYSLSFFPNITPIILLFAFLFLFVLPFYPICLSFHQLSIPPPFFL